MTTVRFAVQAGGKLYIVATNPNCKCGAGQAKPADCCQPFRDLQVAAKSDILKDSKVWLDAHPNATVEDAPNA